MSYLKDYQEQCVEKLTAYFRRTRELDDARLAFLEDPGRGDYVEPTGLTGLPYVCLKVPTGGGKTAIAAYAVRSMLEVLGQRESGPVLWLAPSTPIVEQTIAALRDRSHPYRQELDRAFDGRVTVCDLGGALYLRKPTLEAQCVVIVTTIQALRVEDTDGRKVYEPNGELKHHFDGLNVEQREALFARAAEGEDPTLPTLANVLRMNRPAVVMDEAHNARTPLSFETLRRIGPSCVLELTATPAGDSNVLFQVSAARLKSEQMIKMPVMLRARTHARDAIKSAVEKRKELAELAEAERAEKGYVRPIVLYQAQSGKGELNVEGVKQVLVSELGIDAARVAICTGSVDELPDMPISSPGNPVEHIITVQKLREGWDCPFAYVLCSVGNLGARTAVEQLLGRILRMPYARFRRADELNRAYCYATSAHFQAAANELEAALVENCGFDRYEARRMVRPEPINGEGGLFGETPEPVSLNFAGALDVQRLPAGVREHVTVATRREGGALVTWTGGPMDEAQEAALAAVAGDPRDRIAAARLRKRSWHEDDAPASMGTPFNVPAMAVKEEGQWVLLDDQPLEADWSLADKIPNLSESEFSIKAGDKRVAEVDVNQRGQVLTRFLDDLDQIVSLFEHSNRDTPAKLAYWLDRKVREESVLPTDKQAFLLRMIEDLMRRRGYELGALDRHRHMLKDAAAAKIAALRLNAETTAYQHVLGDGFGISMDCCLRFGPLYPADKLCTASFDWQKHFYANVAAMNSDELEVAKYLDSRPEVMHWVRNLDGAHQVDHAFWLRLPHGRFFPDFVAELVGEKFLVVEFKGEHIEEASKEQAKRRAGEMWAAAAPSELAFVWATADTWKERVDQALGGLTG
ncbi:MAG: DEAD/DEAH box helicase family protein [Phycisphaeraceae bacterium]